MKKITTSFATGAVALVFAVLGYQTALLVHYSASAKIIADRDSPDTVYVIEQQPVSGGKKDGSPSRGASAHRESLPDKRYARHNSGHGAGAKRLRENLPSRRVESFRFNPNTVPAEDLVRLGFSPKQAQSIVNYTKKGGRFRRKEDFAGSFVVSDSVFKRLEPYIDIPLTDLNLADSAAFDALPGIGGYFARKMVEYRLRLGGYSFPEQLMDIYRFDSEKYEKLKDLVTVSQPYRYDLWHLPQDSLKKHPYIRGGARSVVFFREHNPESSWTVENLHKAGIIDEATAEKLSRCVGPIE